MTTDLRERTTGFPPIPPNDRNGGGGGDDGGDWGSGDPDWTPSLKEFMQMTRQNQALIYRDVMTYRCRMQKQNLRATAEHLCEVLAEVGQKPSLENQMENLLHSQAISLAKADEMVRDISVFSLPDVLVWLYADEEQAWQIAEMLGLFDDQDLPDNDDPVSANG